MSAHSGYTILHSHVFFCASIKEAGTRHGLTLTCLLEETRPTGASSSSTTSTAAAAGICKGESEKTCPLRMQLTTHIMQNSFCLQHGRYHDNFRFIPLDSGASKSLTCFQKVSGRHFACDQLFLPNNQTTQNQFLPFFFHLALAPAQKPPTDQGPTPKTSEKTKTPIPRRASAPVSSVCSVWPSAFACFMSLAFREGNLKSDEWPD